MSDPRSECVCVCVSCMVGDVSQLEIFLHPLFFMRVKERKWWEEKMFKNGNTEEESLQGEQSTITDERQSSVRELEETSNA